MKKILATLTLALFIAAISVPAIASVNDNTNAVEMADKDPKKDKKSKSDKKSKDAKSSSDCTTTEKKSSDCSKSCGGK